MGKILFLNIPAHGHVNATLPLVAELSRRGHEVIYYCGDDFREVIKKTGATFRPYPQSDMKHLNTQITAAISENMANVSPLLLRATEILAPYILDEIEREKPDLIMHDAVTIWGRVAAHMTGMPNVVTYTILVLEGIRLDFRWQMMLRLMMNALPRVPAIVRISRRLSKTYGRDVLKLPIFPVKGHKNIVFMAREFQPESSFIDDSFTFVGPSIDARMRQESDWQPLKTDQPLVYISLGTINNQNMAFYRTAFDAFRETPAQFLMSVGRSTDIQSLPTIPPNFIVKNSVPQLQVLEQADVFITHGGMNSIQEGLYFGVSEIVVPQQMEQLFNGVQVAKRGAGILLGDKPPLGQVSATELRTALETVLDDPQYGQAAAQLKQASHDAGGYIRAADEVEATLAKLMIRQAV